MEGDEESEEEFIERNRAGAQIDGFKEAKKIREAGNAAR